VVERGVKVIRRKAEVSKKATHGSFGGDIYRENETVQIGSPLPLMFISSQ